MHDVCFLMVFKSERRRLEFINLHYRLFIYSTLQQISFITSVFLSVASDGESYTINKVSYPSPCCR